MFIIDDILFWGAIIALGSLLVYSVIMTISWFKSNVKTKMAQKNVKKVAAGDLSTLIDKCDNQISMSELEEYADEGYDNFMVSVDSKGHAIGDVELIKNEDSSYEIDKLYGKDGMVVITQ